jgi:hypothetical protein
VTRERSVSMPNRTLSPPCHHRLPDQRLSLTASAAASEVWSYTGCCRSCGMTASHAASPHNTVITCVIQSRGALCLQFTVPKQKRCGSAALSERLEMDAAGTPSCVLHAGWRQSPDAADLLDGSVVLNPAAFADGYAAMVRHSRTRAARCHRASFLVERWWAPRFLCLVTLVRSLPRIIGTWPSSCNSTIIFTKTCVSECLLEVACMWRRRVAAASMHMSSLLLAGKLCSEPTSDELWDGSPRVEVEVQMNRTSAVVPHLHARWFSFGVISVIPNC